MQGHLSRRLAACLLCLAFIRSAPAEVRPDIEALLNQVSSALRSTPEKAIPVLAELQTLRPSLSKAQNERFLVQSASSLGFQGKNAQRVALVNGFIGQVDTPGRKASLLYELIDGNRALGRHEEALLAMNQSILLLPKLELTGDKITVLQGAVSLLYAFHAYDEAMDYAERISALDTDTPGAYARCVGLTDQVDLLFKRGHGAAARALTPDAIAACDDNKNTLFTLIVKTYAAIDLVDSGQTQQGIDAILPLLKEYARIGQSASFNTSLQEALARAYLTTGNTGLAQRYATQAYEQARRDAQWELQLDASKTLAAVQRAQGQLTGAMDYYDIHLGLQEKVLRDQSQMNLAYQRVKFESQDKANQLAMLGQQNKVLNIEKQLQHGKNQNLILLVTLGSVLMVILGAGLLKTLKQKNVFRRSAQIDGLTQISNRAHFTATAHEVFKRKACHASLVLFDMDFFKRVNDTYGHGTGDWVLKAVTQAVSAQLHKGELLGRLGGEEFALCLHNTTTANAMALAERCRAAIANIDSSPSGYQFALTASFGVATQGMNELTNFEETLVAADKALYVSKNGGRNRVTVYHASGDYPESQPAPITEHDKS